MNGHQCEAMVDNIRQLRCFDGLSSSPLINTPKKVSAFRTGKKKMMSIELKQEIIRKHERGLRVIELAKIYDRSTSTICTILKQKDAIKSATPAKGATILSQLRTNIHEEMEKLLLIWVKGKELAGDTVTETVICEKARSIYADLVKKESSTSEEASEEAFKASHGWFDNFKKRTGIHSHLPVFKVKGHQRVPSGSGAQEFKENTKRDALCQLQHELDKLLETASDENRPYLKKQYDGFARLFERFLQEEGPSVDWDKIEKLPPGAVINHQDLPEPSQDEIRRMLNKLIVVKLNGGLGTSMGCHGPKSVISVRNDFTFLDLTVQQIEHLNKTYQVDVPLVLMNSFNTEEDTQKIIRKYKQLQLRIYTFNQSCYPRINRDTLFPLACTSDVKSDMEKWYPPGHGDFYESFKDSGLLKKFIEQGREYCFISNVDNLGATIDLNILGLVLNPEAGKDSPEFVMEVTDKTRADVKGGTLIYYENKLRLLEIAQVPNEHVDDFKSVKSFKFFNTNNLWANLKAIERVVEEKTLNMEVIINYKHLESGHNVIQLETAVGAAMKCFNGCIGVNVPRSRFLPVKKTSDLMLVMSNLYSFKNGSLTMSPQRMFPTTPLVKLGDKHFSKVKDFLSRFASIPDIIELDHLTVSGDVTFGRNVVLKGTVIIIANHGDRIDIPSGACLENKIVSGNMRILDH